MSVTVVAGGKGSPGATTTAVGLAAAWPAAERLLVEADPDGGVLAARFGLSCEPGLVTMAATRGAMSDGALGSHLQRLDGGVSVLCAPTLPEQVAAALRTAGTELAACLGRLGETAAIVDVGRAWPTSAVGAFIDAADVAILVCRPRFDEVQQLVARFRAFRSVVRDVRVVLVGEVPYRPAEVAAVLDPDASDVVVGVLPVDPRTAEVVNAQRAASEWTLRQAPLIRAFAGLAARLSTRSAATPDAARVADSTGSRSPGGTEIRIA